MKDSLEKDDGKLVCQLTHPGYPDFLEEHEMYLQLSVKKGQMKWINSENYFMYWGEEHGMHLATEFTAAQMTFRTDDINYIPKDDRLYVDESSAKWSSLAHRFVISTIYGV